MNKILVRIEYILFRLPLPKVIHDKTVHLFFKQDIEIYNPNGINPNKTFYIIRNHHKDVGLMSYHNTVYYHILRAVNMGAIPIIDMMNYPNTYLKNSKLGKENSWNYFFEQVKDDNNKPYKLQDVYHSRNVILCNGGGNINYKDLFCKEKLDKAYEILEQYIPFNQLIREKIEREMSLIWPREGKVLGCLCRGTDYISLKPSFHAVPPTAEQAIDEVQEKLDLWGCEWVYLATEDNTILEKFKNKFGKKLLYYSCPHYENYSGGRLGRYHYDRDNDEYLKGEDYCITLGLLMKCQSLLLSNCAGSLMVVRTRRNYENVKIFELGLYEPK